VAVIRRYLPLVHQVVQRISRRLPASVVRDDLLAAGLCGLADSLRRNGGSQGESFEAYARIRIQGAVVDELRAQDWLPRRLRSANAVGVEAEVEVPLPIAFLSLDELQGVEELFGLPPANENPGDEAEARSERAALVRAIAQLPERERDIVGMHYFQGVKFKDIGESFGVSEPRISQLHARALGRLRLLLHRAA
jgi:RNA polymerase sigma factor for flagellar operon FliA